ncbi:L-serine dehydratase [Anaerobacterium chartisolvens]|uniref:L-serine dehydratase n=1 Tax=Anaerobacterium chartisolvens TaxID=1297424 RepID=A0A369AK74_9FIRM|nr:L-serine ammonia-lyase, iron-sulfur-dependent, subunit alpha [Anaerobacterium chartisolvens]RCX09571.1 L-serine dehydratase [Anaerobacterium chartisolvens]
MSIRNSLKDLEKESVEQGKKISQIILEDQSAEIDIPCSEVFLRMTSNFHVMKESVTEGTENGKAFSSGTCGSDSRRLHDYLRKGHNICGDILSGALIKSLAVSRYNSCMGRIVAAPTAGSCGIIPAVLLSVMEERGLGEHDVVMSLFNAGGVGMVIASRATLSGAEGGCQAECGSAAAMAASAVVELLGGSPEQCGHACAIALKNTLGLICDPVGGLVQVPCIKRNAMGTANALVAAQLALAGIQSAIPADEVIDAMKAVGQKMSSDFKETAKGGLADTPTARRGMG